MAQRYPINIRLVGVMHKEKTKMYMTSVLWSDQNDIVVYRSIEDFKKLHKQMKKAFPPMNPLKKSDKIIPKFGDKKKVVHKKGPSKSVLRLKSLEKYCSELLSCDARVPQTPELIQFFHPKDQDLQPEFAKNSIVIMPSEDNDKPCNFGNVTQPFVSETYKCVAPYETKDTKNRPFKVAVDESLDVLIKDKAGWWLVENEDKRMAWFPAPYLEKADDEADDETDGLADGGNVMYCATKNYKATNKDEVSLDMGSVVEVLQKSDAGWWLIRYKGKAGYVPAMYLQPYNNPHARLMGLHQNHNSPILNPPSLQVPGHSLTGHSLTAQSSELSRSQGNLLQPPSSPRPLHPSNKHKSRSLNLLSEPDPGSLPVPATSVNRVSPAIMVEEAIDYDRRPSTDSGSSFSDFSSDSGDSSFTLNSSHSRSHSHSSLNVSQGYMDERLRLSRTPPPMVMDRLSPDSGIVEETKMTPSSSDPSVFKAPASPRVPPRPRAQEILTRCTTITRKKTRSPVPTEIASH